MPSFIAIDFETANPHKDSACAIGLVKVVKGKIVAREQRLIDPQDYFYEQFIDVHGITPEDVVEAPTFEQVWKELSPLLKGADFLAAHYAPFDRSVLLACCAAYGIKLPTQPFFCTVRLARTAWNLRPTKLPYVCDALGIKLKHHDPLSDALACARIVLKGKHLLPDLL